MDNTNETKGNGGNLRLAGLFIHGDMEKIPKTNPDTGDLKNADILVCILWSSL